MRRFDPDPRLHLFKALKPNVADVLPALKNGVQLHLRTEWSYNFAVVPPHELQVELDLYSGRPNPVWTIKGVKAAQFIRYVTSLRQPASAPQIPDLGFRGFVLRFAAESARVYQATVLRPAEPPWQGYMDARDLGGILVREAERKGFKLSAFH